MTQFDVAIVGARCAGAPLATILARKGLGVCLLDRAHFPSDTPSTHVIQPSGAQILADLGVFDAALAAGAVPLDRVTLVNEDVRIDARLDPADYPVPGLCVRRSTLDVLLVDAAAAAGADVRTCCRVNGLDRDATGRVTGVQTDAGPISARLVVGADGRHSTVAESVGAAEYLTTPAGRFFAWAYFSGAGRDGRIRLGRLGDHAFLAAPADGGLFMAAVTVDLAHRESFLPDREIRFTDELARWPELAGLLDGAQRVGPVRVVTNWHGYFRVSAGPGWVLVGDAGHFKDPSPGQGISDALRQSAKLADAVGAGVAAGADLDAHLDDWWRWRDRDAYAMYWLAADMGAPGPSPRVITAVLRDIAADPVATAKFLRVINHDLDPALLFTPGRLIRAAVRTLRDRPDLAGATLREAGTAAKDQIYRTVRQRRLSAGRRGLQAGR
ncbi:FAD-dependent monooxygenase [Mycobacterium sp. M1]|uniref:FAD-dependent monooxygenase n=1 Tax=Mycolicibacter acidiphilus TaxID=2835306 RepID=A0ABS5RII7_9MYCO|nr:NAD(P)/FAD-dependent oxidoreductase [Mycolicibacter acidiphilus]MBS9533271.1 FAD-dependent monooxygenase [Mycolicibacter acidiphilus]